jgi:HlyD family secretion protein
MFKKIIKFITTHKIITILIIALVVGGVYYFGFYKPYNQSSGTQYILGKVTKGTMEIVVNGNGNIVAKKQVDVKSKVSGDVVAVNVKNGDIVNKGDLLVQIDTTDALKMVRDAEISLENSRLNLEKAKKSSSNPQNTLNQIEELQEKGLKEVAQTYTDLFPILDSLNNILFKEDIMGDNKTKNIQYYSEVVNFFYNNRFLSVPQDLALAYPKVKQLYEDGFLSYQEALHGGHDDITKALQEAYHFTEELANITKTARDVVELFNSNSVLDNWTSINPVLINQHLVNLRNYYNTINTHLTALLNIINNLESLGNTLSTQSLDTQLQELAVQQKENALRDAQEDLQNCYIRAPFDGIIGDIAIEKGDTVANNSVVATLISTQQLAEITLNEIDIVKVKAGQKAKLTLDALPEVTFSGEVGEVHTLGTESGGVVSYTVEILINDNDNRIKPKMSVTADIIIEEKPNTLMVPNTAVKTQNNSHYVEIPDPKEKITFKDNKKPIALSYPPIRQTVTIGLTDDINTEILEGLKEGDIIIEQTINNGKTTTATFRTQSSFMQQFNSQTRGGGGSFSPGMPLR